MPSDPQATTHVPVASLTELQLRLHREIDWATATFGLNGGQADDQDPDGTLPAAFSDKRYALNCAALRDLCAAFDSLDRVSNRLEASHAQDQ